MLDLHLNSKTLLKLAAISSLFFIVFFSFAQSVNATAGINPVINFQGKVVNKTAGTNVADQPYNFTFKIYDAASSGTLLWTENYNTTNGNQLTVTSGIFRAALGSVCAFSGGSCQGNTNTAIDFNSDSYYLDITFNGETMGSRVQLGAVPYAFNAKTVSGLTVTNNGGNTLNIAANKTLTANSSLTLAGTDGKTLTVNNSLTLAGADSKTLNIGSNNLTFTTSGDTNLTLPTSGTLATTASLLWAQGLGAIYPVGPYTSVSDLLLGSSSTVSAKFGFLNVAFGNPTASIAGNMALGSPTGANPSAFLNILNGGNLDIQTSVGGNTGLSSALHVSNNGFVGISNPTPTEALDVAGNGQFSGNLTVNGGIITTGSNSLSLRGGGDTVISSDAIDTYIYGKSGGSGVNILGDGNNVAFNANATATTLSAPVLGTYLELVSGVASLYADSQTALSFDGTDLLLGKNQNFKVVDGGFMQGVNNNTFNSTCDNGAVGQNHTIGSNSCFSFIIGDSNTADAYDVFIAGESNTVSSYDGAAFGANNQISGSGGQGFISGYVNTITDGYTSSMFGSYNLISTDSGSFVAGTLNTLTNTNVSVAFGSSNELNGGWQNFTSGESNTLITLGADNSAFGSHNSIIDDGINVSYSNFISGDYNQIVGTTENAIFGTGSTISGVGGFGWDNFISGDSNTISGGAYVSSIFGFNNVINSTGGNNHILGGNNEINSAAASSFAFGTGFTISSNYGFGFGLDGGSYSLSQDNTLAIMGGSVGIGTTAPTVALDVVGDGNFSGVIGANGGLINSSASQFAIQRTGGATLDFYQSKVSLSQDGTLPKAFFQLGQTVAPTSISLANTYLQIGQSESAANSYRLIGFGYAAISGSNMPSYIGYLTTDTTDYEKGDLIFGTRDVTTDTIPSERLRITTQGRLGVGTSSPLATLDVRGNFGTLSVASVSGSTSFASLVVDQSGLGDIFTASSSGKSLFTILGSGGITDAGIAAGLTFSGTGIHTVAASSGTLSFASPAITGTPTAAGATWTDLGIVTTADINGGTLDAVTIGGSSAAAGTFTNLTLTGSLTANGSTGSGLCLTGGATATWGSCGAGGGGGTNYFASLNGTLYPLDLTNDLLVGGSSTASATFHVFGANAGFQGTRPVATISANTSFAALVVDQKGLGDIFTASSSGAPKFSVTGSGNLVANNYTNNGGLLYTSTSGLIGQTSVGSGGQCLQSNGGGAPTWGSCGAGGTNWWGQTLGAIYPLNSTVDFLVGGQSTASAKFAVLGVSTNTPVASLSAFSGGIGNGALVLNPSGTLATTNKQSLTLGDSNTGNVVLGQNLDANSKNISNVGTINGATIGSSSIALSNGKTLTISGTTTLADNVITFGGTETLTLAATKNVSFADAYAFAGSAGTLTFQGTDTYVGRATTDILTNKTLTSPAINGTVTTSGLTLPAFTAGGDITLSTHDIVTDTSTGTKFGTATSQKIGFFNSTPIAQPSGNALTALSNLGLISSPTLAQADITGLTTGSSPSFAGLTLTGNLTLSTHDIVTDTSTGTKFGTATSQKIAFFNSTPIVQPSGNALTALSNLGLISSPTLTSTNVGLGNVENTALSSWAGSTNLITAGALTVTSLNLGTGSLTANGQTGSGLCLTGGATANWGSCGGGTATWTQGAGILYPVGPYTAITDLLLGGSASTSAKFAVLNIASTASSNVPVASISATFGTNRPGLVLGGDGTIQTVNLGPLVIGGGQTGDTTITAGSGKLVTVGNGSGNITLSLTNSADVLIADKTFTASGNFSAADFTFKRIISGGANTLNGSVLYVTDISSGSTTIKPDLILANAAPTSGTYTGNLLRLQMSGVDTFVASSSGTFIASALASSNFASFNIGNSATGNITVTSGSNKSITLDSGSGRVSLATGDVLNTSVSSVPNAASASGDIWYDTIASKYKITENVAGVATTKVLCNTTDGDCGNATSQNFSANGSWSESSDTQLIIVQAVGGGGGGGQGGSRSSATAKAGGTGGGGGAFLSATFTASNITSPVTVTVGNGGTGGSGAAANSNGASGNNGNSSSFGTYLVAPGGGSGTGGGIVATILAGGGGGVWGSASGSNAGLPSAAAATNGVAGQGVNGAGSSAAIGPSAEYGGAAGGATVVTAVKAGNGGGSMFGGGGGGGGAGTSTVQSGNGGNGGLSGSYANGTGGGGGAGVSGTPGGSGNNGTSNINGISGSGGGGGASSNAANAAGGVGGNGGAGGGGGGGGGAGVTNGGTAGNAGAVGGGGGSGAVRIFSVRGINADLAEIYGTHDPDINISDVVSLDPSMKAGVKKSSGAYDKTVMGVISTAPAQVIGGVEDPGARGVPVALSGRVPVKVIGDISPGDYLTTSKVAGVATKATKAGPVIGQAMGSYDSGSGIGFGIVMMFVHGGYFNGAGTETQYGIASSDPNFSQSVLTQMLIGLNSTPSADTISEINTDRLAAGLEVITPKVTASDVYLNNLHAATGANISLHLTGDGKFVINNENGKPAITFDSQGNANFAGTITAQKIRANQIEGLEIFTNKLSSLDSSYATLSALFGTKLVLGSATQSGVPAPIPSIPPMYLSDLSAQGLATVSGDIRVRGNGMFEGIVSVIDTLTTNNFIVNGVSTFFSDAFFKGNINFEGRPIFNSDTAGFATIHKGDRVIEVKFDKVYEAEPVISANIYVADMTNSLLTSYVSSGVCSKDDSVEDCQGKVEQLAFANSKYLITRKSVKGFTILLSKDATAETTFSWSAISVKDAKTTVSLKLNGQ